MKSDSTPQQEEATQSRAEEPHAENLEKDAGAEAAPSGTEVGGRQGLDPTRYGDWEKGGRCIDF